MAREHGMENEGQEEEENMAAWLLGIKTLKIQPYHLPPLGEFAPSLELPYPLIVLQGFPGYEKHKLLLAMSC